MKGSDLGKLLRGFADVASGPANVARLADLFEASGSASISAILKRAARSPGAPSYEAAQWLSRLAGLVRPIAKAGVSTDIENVAAFVRSRGIEGLLAPPAERSSTKNASARGAPVDEALVSRSVAALNAALGDAVRFPEVYEEVMAAAGTKEIVAIAREFTPGTAKGAADAKKRIWNRHQALTGVSAKGRATKGRTAA
jgi:hypothetical protein